MAGVPAITQGMLGGLDGMLPGGAPVLSRTVAAWTQESTVAAVLGAVEKAHEDVQIGSYPFWREGRTGANFVIRATEPALLENVATALMTALREIGIDPVDGEL
jgi:molybdopterin-biosynthesis enzyme MoeA-like protein